MLCDDVLFDYEDDEDLDVDEDDEDFDVVEDDDDLPNTRKTAEIF